MGGLGMTLLFMSIKILPTTISFMLFNMNPLLVSVLAYFLLKENLSLTSALCTLGAFGGIVCISLGRKNEKVEGEYQIIGVLLAVLAAVCGSLAYIAMRTVNKAVHYIFSPYYL